MKHFAGHEEEVHERIHADKKADRVEDEIRHEHKAAEDKAYHEMKAEKASWEEGMKVGEKSMRRQEHEEAADLKDEANTDLEEGRTIE
uniref:Uncharacterized protein n=1 Tax=Muribaculaceae bacterium Z82 TaxID=2304548 RepID=A0A7C9JF24_9BACT